MVEMRCEFVLVVSLTLLAAACVIAALLAAIYSVKDMHMHMDNEGEPTEVPLIVIPDSPSPTKHMSTPRASPFLTHRRMRRAGRKRLASHKRRQTMCFDPKLENDCGYQCVLRARGLCPSKRRVVWLRDQVAVRLEKARVHDEVILGIKIHDLLQQEGMTLSAYLAATRSSMWASQIELQIAADILEVPLLYMTKNNCMQLGSGCPHYAIKKVENHYVLDRLHKRAEGGRPIPCPLRAGMQNWTWEEQSAAPSSQIPTAYMHDPYTTVTISDKIKTDIRRITLVAGTMTIADLKARLSSMLKIPVASMIILEADDDNELPDWTSLPSAVVLTVLGSALKLKLDVHVPERNVHFFVEVPLNVTRTELENTLASILRVSQHDMRIVNAHGHDWRACVNPEDHVVHVHILERAGMRTSLTPTVPFGCSTSSHAQEQEQDGEEDGEQSEEVQAMHWRDQVEGAHDGRRNESSPTSRMPSPRASRSRTRSRTRSRSHSRSASPTTSLRRGSASPTRHGHWTTAPPLHLLPAQREPIAKPVIDTNGRPVGYIWANPDALATEVKKNVRISLNIYPHMIVEPQDVSSWSEVERILVHPRPQVPVRCYRDMRIDRWELFQKPRPVPILYGGLLEKYAVYPWNLSLACAQYRLDLWARSRHTYVIQAIDTENWVILKRDLPQRFVEPLNTLQNVVRNMIERAGVRVWYAYAHSYQHKIKYDNEDGSVIADLVNDLADKHSTHSDNIVITTDEWLPNLHDPLHVYVKNVLYVILLEFLEHPDYIETWPWEIHVMQELATIQRGEPAKCSVAEKTYDPTPYYLQVPSSLPKSILPLESPSDIIDRAGMPRVRQPDPKAVMLGWAEQKIRDEAPEAQGKTIMMLMKAEPRTATAIMHAKSPTQTKEVIIAAYRRAGLPSPFHAAPQPVPAPDPNFGAMMSAMTEQTRLMGEIAVSLHDIPKQEHYQQLVTHMNDAQQSYVRAVESLAMSVARLEHTMSVWESAYLPHIVGVAPKPPAPTPEPPTPTELGTQEYDENDDTHMQQEPTSSEQPEEVREPHMDLPGIQRMQDRSLKHCCERVVADNRHEGPKREALRPFRSRA